MQEADDYLRNKLKEYYEDSAEQIRPPPDMEKREYGFLLFREGVMVRHKAFKTTVDLQAFIRTTVPAHAYSSTAYYLAPDKEMDRKDWQGADLAFDVDADHIATPCKNTHDRWVCTNCTAQGRGPAPDKCPKCLKEKIEADVWLCEICLERAKEEVIKLLDFLTEDFGFSRKDMTICFSGHRGYHAHLRADEARNLNGDERKEIVDYILGLGFDSQPYSNHFSEEREQMDLHVEESGWRRRIYRGTYEILTEISELELTSWGINRRIAKTINQKRDEFASMLMEGKRQKLPDGIGPATWKTIIQKAVEREAANVDTVVTTDIHRLIRLPETLNAKTGFKAAEVSNIEAFDPFSDAVVFKGDETVYVKEVPQFRIGNQTLGPYANQVVTIPTAAAIFLIAKGKAILRRT